MPKILDIIFMKTLGNLFGSAAKTEILRALNYQPDGTGLRQLTRIAGLRVRSAELALKFLVRSKLVRRRRIANRVSYAMDWNDPRASLLTEVFAAAAAAAIRAESHTLDQRARRLLPFMRGATRMLDTARRSRHDA
jgi:hypothetical protein